MIGNEIKRAICSKGMLLAMIVGNTLWIAYGITMRIYSYNAEKSFEELKEKGIDVYITMSQNSPFDIWMFGHMNKYFLVFMYLFPILAALPFAASYCSEKKSGYEKNVVTRTSRKNYLRSKYWATFISGGISVAVPFFLSFMWIFTMMKYRDPISASQAPMVSGTSFMCILYFTHPFIYCFVFLVAIFVFGGFLATTSLSISQLTGNFFTVILTPFMVTMFLESIFMGNTLMRYLPINFLAPMNGGNKLYMVLVGGMVLWIISYTVFVRIGEKKGCL